MPVPEADVHTTAAAVADGAPLFDVRNPDEFVDFRVAAAVLVPLRDVPERVEEFPTDRTVYVICKTGARSARAVEFLRAQGVDAVNVAGGSLAWREAGLEVVSGP